MIDFYIVKLKHEKSVYDPFDDTCFASLEKAWQHVIFLSEEKKIKVTNYYILRFTATNLDEIVGSFNSNGSAINHYDLLNTFHINEGDSNF